MAAAKGARLAAPVDFLAVAAAEGGVECLGAASTVHRHAEADAHRHGDLGPVGPEASRASSIGLPDLQTDHERRPMSGTDRISASFEKGVTLAIVASRWIGARSRSSQPGGGRASEFRMTACPPQRRGTREPEIDRRDETRVLGALDQFETVGMSVGTARSIGSIPGSGEASSTITTRNRYWLRRQTGEECPDHLGSAMHRQDHHDGSIRRTRFDPLAEQVGGQHAQASSPKRPVRARSALPAS